MYYMTNYLSYQFEDTEAFIETFDELPLWSAPFGLLLLKHLELKPNQTVLDIGSGTGFPLMELAGRLGSTCKLYGIDPWKNAYQRTLLKIQNYQYNHVEVIECSAEEIPFPDQSIDLIVSNLGINNFSNPQLVFQECHRVLKAGGRLVLTTNLVGHWKEFYQIFYQSLTQLSKTKLIAILEQDELHRGTMESITQLFTEQGLFVTKTVEEHFEMQFLDGSAFLNHHFVKLGWLRTWMGLFPKEDHHEIFSNLEKDLNAFASAHQGLNLTVPMAYIEGEKQSM